MNREKAWICILGFLVVMLPCVILFAYTLDGVLYYVVGFIWGMLLANLAQRIYRVWKV